MSVFFLVAPTFQPPRGSWLVDHLQSGLFLLPGYHSARYPCGEGEILPIYRRRPVVLPWPVHGPIWAELQWMHVILRCSCACLAPPRTPLGGKFDVVGWQQGCSEMEANAFTECTAENQQRKKKLPQFPH